MVSKTSAIFRRLLKGYTLVEVVIVLGIIAFMGAMTIYGFSNQNNDQRVVAAQREIIVNLRSIQTKVNSGVDGKNVQTVRFDNGNGFYCINDLVTGCPTGTKINLTAGVTLSVGPTPVVIYFSHQAYTGHLANQCGSNVDKATFFACSGIGAAANKCDGTVTCTTVPAISTTAKIGFTGSTRTVTVEGVGMRINRIYE